MSMRTRLIACVVVVVALVAGDVSAQVKIEPRPYVGGSGTAVGSITFPTGAALRTGTTSGDTLSLSAYDVDGAAYTALLILEAGNTPTMTALFGDGTAAAPSVSFLSDPDTGLVRVNANRLGLNAGGFTMVGINDAEVALRSDVPLSWSSGTNVTSATDVRLIRDAAGVLAQKLSDTAQEFRVYGATTGSKYASLSHSGANGVVAASSGSLYLNTGSTTRLYIGSGGGVYLNDNNLLCATDGGCNIGAAGANRPNNLYVVDTLNGHKINLAFGTITDPYTLINATATWNDAADTFTGWFMNVTDTASASGSLLVDLQVGSASKFKVRKDGYTTLGGSMTLPSGGFVGFSGRSQFYSPSDGSITLWNDANTGFAALNLGPTTGNTATGVSAIKHVETVLDMATATGTGTGTITSPTTALPVGLIKGVACRVTTVLAGAGLTTFSIGDGTDVDRWGVGIAIAAGTTTSIANYTVSSPAYQTAAGSIVLTAAAGVFSSGILKCTTYVETQTPISN